MKLSILGALFAKPQHSEPHEVMHDIHSTIKPITTNRTHTMFCSKCGTQQDDSAKVCTQCNYALSPISEAEPELTQDEMYQAVIGHKNQAYYLNHFSKFDADGKSSVTWHWPALFIPFYWLLYRKMWPQAILYFVSPYIGLFVIGIAAAILGDSAATMIGILYLIFVVALFIFPAMFANALYYKHCKNEIVRATARKFDKQRTLAELIGNGGTSGAALIVVLIFGFIAIIGILAAIAIPAYQDYTIKARLVQTYTIEQEAARTVDTYYNQHHTLPANLAEAGYTTPLPAHIKSITINPENGTLVATLTGAQIEGKTLLLTPSKDENNTITWACQNGINDSNTISDKYLPSACKQR
jgi:Tfp pilus assembly protein PilE